jgi:hypothetical protein
MRSRPVKEAFWFGVAQMPGDPFGIGWVRSCQPRETSRAPPSASITVEGVLRALMAHAQVDEAFGARFRESFLQRRRDALGEIVERARERGDLPPGISPGTVADIVFGVIWYRVLARDEPPGPQLTEELITALS